MTTTDETFQQTVLALRDWLNYLEEKKDETARQLERARRNPEAEKKETAPVIETESEDAPEEPEKAGNAPEMEPWL